jgi:hypothetical protein
LLAWLYLHGLPFLQTKGAASERPTLHWMAATSALRQDPRAWCIATKYRYRRLLAGGLLVCLAICLPAASLSN